MCGIFGVYSTTFGRPEYDLFEKLMYINVFRGQDSTGVLRVSKDKKFNIQKSLLPSPAFINSNPEIISDKFKGQGPLLLMGHCRAATKGALTLKNAHPFRFKDIAGMHNGTIHKKFTNYDKFETDSEGLFNNIQEMGLQKALQDVEDWDTAYALQWINMEDGTLNFILNKKRPLEFCYLYGGQTLVWSSDLRMLKFAIEMSCATSNMIGWDKSKTDSHSWTLKKYDHYSLKIGSSADSGVIHPVKVEEKKTYTSIKVGTYGSNTSVSSTYRPYVPKALPSPSQIAAGTKSKTVDLTQDKRNPRYRNYRGRFLDEALRGLEWLTKDESGTELQEPHDRFVDQQSSDDRPAPDPDLNGVTDFSDLDDDYVPWKEEGVKSAPAALKKGGSVLFVKGYEGKDMTENELTYRLAEGCLCCDVSFDLSDPHDFWDIENMHWADEEHWACEECYTQSEGDWVRLTCDGADEDEWREAAAHHVSVH